MSATKEATLKNAFAAAVAVADPKVIVSQYLAKIFPKGQEPKGRCLVVGAGKASASMASALESYAQVYWPHTEIKGIVLTRYGHNSPQPVISKLLRLDIQRPTRLVWMAPKKSWHSQTT